MKAIHTEGLFRSSDDLILFEQRWHQPGASRGAMVLVHGYAEHSGRYTALAQRLVDEGFSVYTFDQRGHGKSEGLRGFIPRFEQLVDDLTRYLVEVRRHERRIYLFGHSMGGAVLAHYLAAPTDEISGAVFSSAALAHEKRVPLPFLLFSRLSAAIFPGGPLPAFIYSLETEALSREQTVVEEYNRDPFVYHGPMLNRTAWEIYRALSRMPKTLERIHTPFIALHGEADRLTDPKGTRMLHERAPATDKTLHLYPEGYHELFNDLCREEAWRDLSAWLRERSEVRDPKRGGTAHD